MVIPDFSDPAIWLSLLTLTFLEIILGVDNIIFISIISDKLSEDKQKKARNIGLMLAMLFRVGLLLTITWILKLKDPLFELPLIKDEGKPIEVSWKDLILMAGGIFLVIKSTIEIHHKMEKPVEGGTTKTVYASMASVIVQIILIDAVFSFDSILTAIGLVEEVMIMIIAVVISILLMMIFAGPISRFINRNPTLQILALAFLIAIGIMLVAEGFHQKISKSYIYTMIAFSLIVEMINLRIRKKHETIKLNQDRDLGDRKT